MLFEADAVGALEAKTAGFVLPEGAYTTFRTYERDRILLLDRHIHRLIESRRLQGTSAQLPAARVASAVRGALAATGFPESRLRLTFAPPALFVGIWPFEELPARLYEEGATCVTLPLRRDNPQAKDTRFQRAAADAYGQLPDGVHEGLMWDPRDGALLEGLSSNFFALVDGELRTDDARVLHGVTRSLVIELAHGLAPVRLEAVRRDELSRADEACLTSVSRGVLGVRAVDGALVGTGRPGPITRELSARLARFARTHAQPVTARSPAP